MKKEKLRGHLKSSHFADKRKNFHMALYPLPSSSNESVIGNGTNVLWQTALHIILVLPHRAKTVSSISRRDASPEVQRPLRNEQGDNLEEINNFYFSFSFSAHSKADGGC